jgi:hypothetical protein
MGQLCAQRRGHSVDSADSSLRRLLG